MNYEGLFEQASKWRKFDEDTVAQAILTFLEKPPTSPKAAPQYLYRICQSLQTEHYRKRAVLTLTDAIDPEPQPEPANHDLSAAIEQLDSYERTVIVMAFFQGYKRTEIANDLGIEPSEVTNYQRNAISKLKKHFVSLDNLFTYGSN